ncbi:hypothetical protein GlitD10_0748 [Gloeomargarita lithophora Alchichica-D10]|uniref:Uncharacterized protein n=1 Tax=Gloeomargarita lithophora Alchichica-D10 TaxID=1188229 RepID=A0A1J0AAV6_9CYAN|nr:hypothetical protein [Gloeomargarita lithophora]APB33062.1 hypothetical protein GlitD10_0748 [Gloeomargarita lithophora Alchichica-D10]
MQKQIYRNGQRVIPFSTMKMIYHDEERLVLETKSGGFYSALVKRLFQSSIVVTWLVLGLGIFVAYQKTVQCTKTGENLANCQVTNTYFWGLLRYVATIDNVSQVVFETSTASKRRSRNDDRRRQYSVYEAVIVSPKDRATIISKDSTETNVPIIQKNSYEYVQQVKNEFETFLNSAETNYHFSEGLWRNIGSGLLLLFSIPVFLVWMMRRPYRGCLIFNKKQHEFISSGEALLGENHSQTHPWNGICLWFFDYTGNDNHDGCSYEIELVSQISRNDINLQKARYPLKQTNSTEEAQAFWESDPDVQILKQFVRSEVKN